MSFLQVCRFLPENLACARRFENASAFCLIKNPAPNHHISQLKKLHTPEIAAPGMRKLMQRRSNKIVTTKVA